MILCAEIGLFNLDLTQLTLKTSGIELLNFLQLTLAISYKLVFSKNTQMKTVSSKNK